MHGRRFLSVAVLVAAVAAPAGAKRPAPESLRTAPLPRPSGRIQLKAQTLDRELDVTIYRPDGSFDQEALAALDEMWACRQTREVRAVDPRLYEVLATIYDHFGGQQIVLLSGFRFQQNEGSRHYHASAMDIRIPGVSYKELYAFAVSLDTGGMGIGQYPRMNFVHIDFRAPGEPSYHWTDGGRTDPRDPGLRPTRKWKRSRRPNS